MPHSLGRESETSLVLYIMGAPHAAAGPSSAILNGFRIKSKSFPSHSALNRSAFISRKLSSTIASPIASSSQQKVDDHLSEFSSSPPLSQHEASTPTNPPTHHLITLKRSAIGLPTKFETTLKMLGLRKRHSSSLYPFSANVAGRILRVKELVEVRNVTKEEGERLLKSWSNRSEGSGVAVTGRAFGGARGASGGSSFKKR